MVTRWFQLMLVITLLAGLAGPAFAATPAQQIPSRIQQFARPGERVTALTPVIIGGRQYRLFCFHTGGQVDPSGDILYNNLPGRWTARGVQGVLVTDDSYRPIRDEDLLRQVFLAEMAGHMTTQLGYVPEIVVLNQGLVDMMYSLTENPIYRAAFLLQEAQSTFASLLQNESQEYVEAFRMILALPGQDDALLDEFSAEVRSGLEAGADLKAAVDDAILLAKFSNSRRIREVAKDARKLFDEWNADASLGTVDIRIGGSRFNLDFGNALDLISLAMELIFLQELSLERAEMLESFAAYARQEGPTVSPLVLNAIDTVVAEARNANRHRFDLIREFLADEAGKLAVALGREALVKLWKDWAWREFGKRTVGHLVAGAAAQVLLGYSLSSLLFGFDAIYENTLIGQRASELVSEFDSAAAWVLQRAGSGGTTYDATLCDFYRTAFLFKNLSATQLSRSYADMIAGSRLLKNVGDLLTGNQWTEAEEFFREDAEEGALRAEEAALRPPIIDYAVKLALERAATVPDESSESSATVLVMDVSGSMEWSDPTGGRKIDAARHAAGQILNMIRTENEVHQQQHQVALVAFSEEAWTKAHLTSDVDTLSREMSYLEPLEGTNLFEGMAYANRELDGADPTAKPIMILLSDGVPTVDRSGQPDEDLQALKQAVLEGPVAEAAQAGYCIYVVGFGDPDETVPSGGQQVPSLDEPFLRQIADPAVCGAYYPAEDADQLAQQYIRMRHQSLGEILGEFHGEVREGERVEAGQVDVPAGQGELYASLYWPGSVLGLVLTDPRGQPVDEDYPDATISTYSQMVYAVVNDPVQGTWDVDVSGEEVPSGNTWFDVVVSSRTGSADAVQSSVGVGPALLVLVVVVGAVGLLVLSATRGRVQTAAPVASEAIRPRLIVRSGRRTGREFNLISKGLAIGRARANEVRLEDASVSRHHAVIRLARGRFFLQDQDSTGGTFVNGRRVSATRLKDGDLIQIGSTEFEFRVD